MRFVTHWILSGLIGTIALVPVLAQSSAAVVSPNDEEIRRILGA